MTKSSLRKEQRLYDLMEHLTDRMPHASPAELDALLHAEPTLAKQIEDLLPVLQAFAAVAPDRTPPTLVSTAGEPHRNPAASQPKNQASTTSPEEWLQHLGFSIVRELGRGGMGIVFEAREALLARTVAVKVLPTHCLQDDLRRTRFRHEAFAAAQLQHRNIVDIYSVHCHDALHFYVMRYVNGLDLARALREEREISNASEYSFLGQTIQAWSDKEQHLSPSMPNTSETVLDSPSKLRAIRRGGSTVGVALARARFVAHLGRQAAESLAYAHATGVIHRDIKPSNLIVERSGHLWVTDFGLARVEQLSGLTQTGDILGTLNYMSPEQWSGNRAVLDHRTDIYSLGRTLIEVLLGTPAEPRTELERESFQAKLPTNPGSLRRQFPGLPVDLETILLKCVNELPSERYANAHLLADDLTAFLENRPIRAKPPGIVVRTSKWIRRHQKTAAAVAGSLVVGLTMAAASLFLMLRERQARFYQELLGQQQTEVIQNSSQLLRQHQYATDIQLAHQAWKELHIDVAEEHLRNCLPDVGEADLRGFEWYFLDALTKSTPKPIGQHDGDAYYIDFSHNGRWMATSGSDGIRIFETSDWRQVAHLQTHASDVNAVQFSTSDRWLISAGDDQSAIVWRTDDWQVERVFSCDQPVVFACMTSDESSIMACQRESTVEASVPNIVSRFELASGELQWKTLIPGGSLHGATYLADRNCMAMVADAGVYSLVDCQDGSLQQQSLGGVLYSVADLPGTGYVVIGDGLGNLHFRSLDSEVRRSFQFACADKSIESLAIVPEQRRLIHASRDGTVGIWRFDLDISEEPVVLERVLRHRSPLWCARLDASGQNLVTVDRVGAVTVWELQRPNVQTPQNFQVREFAANEATHPDPAGLFELVSGSRFFDTSADGRFAAGTFSPNSLQVWELPSGRLRHKLDGNELLRLFPEVGGPNTVPQAPYTCSFIPQYGLLSVTVGDQSIVLDPESGKRADELGNQGILDSPYPIWHPSDRFYAAITWDQYLEIWDAKTGRLICRPRGPSVSCVAWSPSGEHLLVGHYDGYASIRQVPDRQSDPDAWSELSRFVTDGHLSYSPDGKTIAASTGSALTLWNATTQRELLEISPPTSLIWSNNRFSRDGRRLTIEGMTSDGQLEQYVWSLDP